MACSISEAFSTGLGTNSIASEEVVASAARRKYSYAVTLGLAGHGFHPLKAQLTLSNH
jgi:hypothetical protein